MHHTTEYDSELSKISFYKQYPEYLPFIGVNYVKNSGILLLGESHYFPKNSSVHKNPDNWYQNSNKNLSDEEVLWIDTRRVVNNIHGKHKPIPQKWKKSRTIFRNIESALIEAKFPKTDNLFCHVAFMNSFQRPAEETGKSIIVRPIDIQQSDEIINRVIKIIQPKYICFVSSKASKHLAKKITVSTDVVAHPASPWWNRLSKKGVSREIFIELLKKYNA